MATALNGAVFPLAPKDAFLISSGPFNGNHLFVILTDPAKNAAVLMVNATTCRNVLHDDSSCLLNVGDHPFINHPSFVLYSKARIVPQQKLRTGIIAREVFHQPPPVSDAVFAMIVAGLNSIHLDPIKMAFFLAHR